MSKELKDITGQKFGEWTVLGPHQKMNKSNAWHWLCRCSCLEEQWVEIRQLRSGKSKSCKYCAKNWKRKYENDMSDQKFNSWTVIGKTFRNKNRAYLVPCVCFCGRKSNVRREQLFNGTSKCCKHCSKMKYDEDLTGKRFNKWTVDKYSKFDNGNHYWWARCDCGTYKEVERISLIKGLSKSCGCEFKHPNLLGKTFGFLKVIEKCFGILGGVERTFYKCLCEKCNTECNIGPSELIHGKRTSCGNCGIWKNGVQTSWKALELHDIINTCVGDIKTEHNYFTDIKSPKGRRYNVDIALPDEKIAIEYDSKKWHKGREEQDQIKTDALIAGGWKVLRVKYGMPTKQELDIALNLLRKYPKQKLVTLEKIPFNEPVLEI